MKLAAVSVLFAAACASASAYRVDPHAPASDVFFDEAAESQIAPLILSGTEVPVGDKLYLAGLRSTVSGGSFCGGALITPRHVLSAGHCAGAKYVSVATHYRSGTRDGQQLRVAKETRHPKYAEPDNNAATYDFTVLELASAAVNVTPVALLRTDPAAIVGQKVTTIGWGRTGYPTGAASNVLLRGDGPVVSDAACKAAGLSPLDESMVCAGGAKNTGACFGDSGGPLVLERAGGDLSLGVVSWGYPNSCGLDGKPVVFGRIAHVASWIATNAPGVRFVDL